MDEEVLQFSRKQQKCTPRFSKTSVVIVLSEQKYGAPCVEQTGGQRERSGEERFGDARQCHQVTGVNRAEHSTAVNFFLMVCCGQYSIAAVVNCRGKCVVYDRGCMRSWAWYGMLYTWELAEPGSLCYYNNKAHTATCRNVTSLRSTAPNSCVKYCINSTASELILAVIRCTKTKVLFIQTVVVSPCGETTWI